MEAYKTELERVFELARSGRHPDVNSILRLLRVEGYSGNQVVGKSLKMHLADLIEEAAPTTQSVLISLIILGCFNVVSRKADGQRY
jgi:hypothetical protein